MRGIFIAGSDTGVGKTTFACKLISQLTSDGIDVAPRKPVESGCRRNSESGKLIAKDADAMAYAMSNPPPSEQICPYRFAEAISPARAGTLNNVRLSIEDLYKACQCSKDEFAIVEGAGGLFSPLAYQCNNADLAKKINMPLILIVADKLGCINHTLLSLFAAEAMKIKVLAVVVNYISSDDKNDDMDNFEDLKALCNVPLFKMQSLNTIDSTLYQWIVSDAQNHSP